MTNPTSGASLRRAEEYYAELWRKPTWGESSPNEDEAARWQAMEPLVATSLEGIAQPLILDLGCGRGWLTELLSHHGETLGIDPVVAGIERARQLFPERNFRHCSAADLLAEGAAGRFDLIVSSEVIEHVPHLDKPGFVGDTAALLKSHGHLLLTTPRGELWEPWRRGASRTQPVEEWLNEGQLDRLAQEANFELVARRRAYRMRRPLNWQSWVLKWVLFRRGVRRIPLAPLTRRLEHAAAFYQVALYRRLAHG